MPKAHASSTCIIWCDRAMAINATKVSSIENYYAS